jgi:hypothetical protein
VATESTIKYASSRRGMNIAASSLIVTSLEDGSVNSISSRPTGATSDVQSQVELLRWADTGDQADASSDAGGAAVASTPIACAQSLVSVETATSSL